MKFTRHISVSVSVYNIAKSTKLDIFLEKIYCNLDLERSERSTIDILIDEIKKSSVELNIERKLSKFGQLMGKNIKRYSKVGSDRIREKDANVIIIY